jgi:hypothetical protein
MRETTRDIRESIAQVTERRARVEVELRDARTQAVRESEEFEARQAVARKRSQRVAQLEEELTRLQVEVERLKAEIGTKQSERDCARQGVGEVEAEAGGLRKSQRGAEKRAEELVGTLTALEKEKLDLRVRLKLAYAESLRKYLAGLRGTLLQAQRAAAEMHQAKAALEALRAARHQDGEVASLCEAREEWQRLLKGAAVPAVLETGRRELQRIDGDIERRFPGALQAESIAGRDRGVIEELFFIPRDASGRVTVCLPLDRASWDRLEAGQEGDEIAWGVELVWEIRNQLNVDWVASRFSFDERLGSTVLEVVGGSEIGQQTVEMSLRGGGVASFILSSVPTEIAEALNEHA